MDSDGFSENNFNSLNGKVLFPENYLGKFLQGETPNDYQQHVPKLFNV